MKITPVDETYNLFKITDVASPEIVDRMLNTDWLSQPWSKPFLQEKWNRRQINNNEIINQVHDCIWGHKAVFENICKMKFASCYTMLWLDYEDFTVYPHIDNKIIKVSIQLYWSINDKNLGTTFYYDKDAQRIRYVALYIVNSGYLMINDFKTLYHGMLNPVPKNTYRLSTYTTFNSGP